MTPETYWQSLNASEKQELCDSVQMSKSQLSHTMCGRQYASLSKAVLIADNCNNQIKAVDLISPENRKAIKEIK